MKKLLSTLLVLTLLLGILPMALASPPTAGAPDFVVSTELLPSQLVIYQGEEAVFTATTTYTSNKNENQQLHFVSDAWVGVDSVEAAVPTLIEVEVSPESAAQPGTKQHAFISTGRVYVADLPGDYEVAVRYTITLQHDASGQRTYQTVTTSEVFTITVLEGERPQQQPETTTPPQQAGEPLNHGQIVSAWAHWKQTKGNKNFAKGGPSVRRSVVWYKTQVEYKTFYSQQEVWDYLDSIYEPAARQNKGKPNKNK